MHKKGVPPLKVFLESNLSLYLLILFSPMVDKQLLSILLNLISQSWCDFTVEGEEWGCFIVKSIKVTFVFNCSSKWYHSDLNGICTLTIGILGVIRRNFYVQQLRRFGVFLLLLEHERKISTICDIYALYAKRDGVPLGLYCIEGETLCCVRFFRIDFSFILCPESVKVFMHISRTRAIKIYTSSSHIAAPLGAFIGTAWRNRWYILST